MARTIVSNVELVDQAVSLVLEDEDFKIPSESAKVSLKIAKALKKWSSQPSSIRKNIFKRFANELVNRLRECFQTGQVKSLKKRRERMWESYHKLIRCSSSFKLLWSNFLVSAVAGCQAEPILYQYLTDRVMEMLIRIEFPVTDCQDHKVAEGLDVEEKYALRYAAGYVVRALKKKVKQSGHPMKKEIELCLSEMVEEDASERVDESDKWTTAVDRGGLIHVSDLVYQVFADMELTLRMYLKHRPDDVVNPRRLGLQ